jgi:hypothetical protein
MIRTVGLIRIKGKITAVIVSETDPAVIRGVLKDKKPAITYSIPTNIDFKKVLLEGENDQSK